MAAHPGLSISSSFLRETSGVTSTPQAFRHRYHTRRKRSATTTVGMAAAHSGSGKVSRRDSEGGGRGSGVATLFASNGHPEHLPEDDGTSDMRIDMDAGVAKTAASPADGSRIQEEQSACRWGRVLSCPAVEHRPAASTVRPAAATAVGAALAGLSGAFVVTGSADNVSSARGITIGDVHGSVRAKTATAEVEQPQAPAPASPSASAEAAAAAAAIASKEAAETAAAIARHYSGIAAAEVVSMSLGGEDPLAGAAATATASEGIAGVERILRSASSGASFACEPVPEASNKRAKSGATGAVGDPLGGQDGWTTADSAAGAQPPELPKEEDHPTPAEAMSSMSIDAAATPPGENTSDASAPAAATPVDAQAAPAPAVVAEPAEAPATVALSNEEWLAKLSPLLESIPAGAHPEDYLHDILRERGYTTEMVAMKETIFHRPPEADQVAAYDKAILRAVVDEDEAALERMRAAGRRMDACNRFGDSVLHMACRRGRAVALRFLLRATGPSGVVLSDDFGRTVMHDACWTASPRFDVASAVLDSDTRLLRTLDSRGSSPLQYVPQDQWPLWCAFFESRKEVYWPPLPPGAEDLAGIIPLTV